MDAGTARESQHGQSLPNMALHLARRRERSIRLPTNHAAALSLG